MAKKTFFVCEPLRHDGVDYAVGEKLALEAKEAAGLLAAGALSADAVAVESTEEAEQAAAESESPAE